MNDIRRTILWVVFGFSMVMLWDQWQIASGQPATFFPAPKPAVVASAAVTPASATLPSASATAPGATPPAGTAAAPASTRERFTVTTDVMRLTFDTQGGSLTGAEFLKHAADAEDGKPSKTHFVLLEDNANRHYVAQTGLIGGDFPNHTTVMTASAERALKDGAKELVVRFESPDKGGVKLVKTYTLQRGAYDVAVKHEIINTGSTPVSPRVYLQLVRDGSKLPGESAFYSTFTGPAVYTDEQKFQKVEFTDIDKNKVDFQKSSAQGYVAMVQHYFASAWILPGGVQRELFVRKPENNRYAVGMITPAQELAPGRNPAPRRPSPPPSLPAPRKKRCSSASRRVWTW
jgi:YidC/Oxa1 family membrane protein insertase